MTAYEQLAAQRPEMDGMPIIAILEPDGHQAIIPMAAGILDDEPMRPVVVGAFADLLEARKISKAHGPDPEPAVHEMVDDGKFARCRCGEAWGYFPGGFGCPDAPTETDADR